MQMDLDVSANLKQIASKVPADQQQHLAKFDELYNRKYLDILAYCFNLCFRLWHQLTMLYMEFMVQPAAKPFLAVLYERFVSAWEKKVKKTSLVQIVVITANQISGM